MTNLEKMIELVGSEASKKEVIDWAFMNNIYVAVLPLEEEFKEMKNSVLDFMDSNDFNDHLHDELKLWDLFLDREFIP